jgi:hypothetical protein
MATAPAKPPQRSATRQVCNHAGANGFLNVAVADPESASRCTWLLALVGTCRRLEVAVHRLTDPPPASLVEADRRPSSRNPELLVTLPVCPPLKVREQMLSDT